GGGEAANEKVSIRAASDPINEADYDGSDEAIMWKITKYAASLAADFTENSPYRSLPMQNPTEKLAVIGRRTLNYCYNYGEESNVRIFKTHTDIF
ncbi:MAG TPA: hypothetical protein PLT66_04340, partial [Bacillota bacterium]|nr:hypothetical protein [Bacillota bacterium]